MSLVCLGTLGGLVGGHLANLATGPDPAAPRISAEVGELRDDLEALRATVAVHGRVEAASAAEAPSPEPAEPHRATRSREELTRESEAEDEALEAMIDGLLADGPPSLSNETRLLDDIAAYEAPTADTTIMLISSRCTAAICRLEFAHRDPDAVQRMMVEFMPRPGWSGNGFVRRHETPEGHRSIVFLSQDGSRLPRLAAGEALMP